MSSHKIDSATRFSFLIFFGLILIVSALAFGSSSSSNVDAASKVPDPAPNGSNYAQRLKLRKSQQHIKLNIADKNHIVNSCSDAQTKLHAIIEQTTAVLGTHNDNYDIVDGLLWTSIGQIKLAKKDTFHLQQKLETYISDVSTFRAFASDYQQALNDLVTVNCQADPVGFLAFLQTARAYYEALAASSGKINSYVKDDVLPALEKHASELQPKYTAPRS